MTRKPPDLLNGAITARLLRLSFPMIIAFGFQTSYNFVDRYFVSRLGDVSTAAIGMAFIIQLVIIALGAGLGMGLNSFIARNLGANRKEPAIAAVFHSFILAIIVGSLITTLGLIFGRTIFHALGADNFLLQSIMNYLTPIFYFAPVYLLAMISNNIFRGWGDTVFPMKFMLTGTLLNILLDPLLIFGWGPFPAFGITGAALATGISRTIALLYTLYILMIKNYPVRIKFSVFKFNWRIIQGIFQVGLPASLGQILMSFTLSIIFLILNTYGDVARAAYTIAFTYEMLAFLPVIGIAQAVAIMTGHNYGAQKYLRVKKIYFDGIKLSTLMMFLVSVIIFFNSRIFAAVFSRSQEVLEVSLKALKIMSPGYLFIGVFMCAAASFQGIGLGRHQLIATISRIFLFIIPLTLLGSFFLGLDGVWFGMLGANILSALGMFSWFYYLYSQKLIKGKIATL